MRIIILFSFVCIYQYIYYKKKINKNNEYLYNLKYVNDLLSSNNSKLIKENEKLLAELYNTEDDDILII
jgi:hypothetical protein